MPQENPEKMGSPAPPARRARLEKLGHLGQVDPPRTRERGDLQDLLVTSGLQDRKDDRGRRACRARWETRESRVLLAPWGLPETPDLQDQGETQVTEELREKLGNRVTLEVMVKTEQRDPRARLDGQATTVNRDFPVHQATSELRDPMVRQV